MGRKYEKIYRNCNICSVCGGSIRVEESFGGLFARICCINHKDRKMHGGILNNTDRRRFTNWYFSSRVEELISHWNWLNKV